MFAYAKRPVPIETQRKNRNMSKKEMLKLFEDRKVRTVWDDETEKWYFSIVDVVAVLNDSDYQTARKYWKVLKGRLIKEGNEMVTNCYQSVPSPKAEPFKQWMAQVAAERLDQLQDPELSIEQAVADYRRLGYSESWINQRGQSCPHPVRVATRPLRCHLPQRPKLFQEHRAERPNR